MINPDHSREHERAQLHTASAPGDARFVIPFRDPKLTKSALDYAAGLISKEEDFVRLIDVQVVPYGVPLNHPGVDARYLQRRLKELGRESELRVSPQVTFARVWEQGFRRVLPHGATVLIPFRRSEWNSSEKRLASRLRRQGHQVIWVESN
jgi:hypothetical protein